ncbi:hypothetical protein ACHAPU_000890 [Fusarium lateritium]
MTSTQVLRISRFDPASSTSKQKQIIQLEKSIKDEKLSEVRKLLRKNNVFDSKDFKSPFCEKDGADVGDDMKFELYLALIGIESSEEARLDVYFKAKKIFSPIDQATQDSISEKLDLAFQQEPELIKKNPELLTSSFNPAFKIKPREFEAYEISSVGEEDISGGDGEKFHFRIPRFRVDDDSSVTVFETKTSFEKSMANSSFSETSFQVAAGGGMFGVSVSAQAGASTGATDSTASVEAKEESSLVVNYNFPRVTLYWDHKSLAVSEECLEDIKAVVDPRTLNEFNEKYGHIFSTRVQLGGRLSSSQKVVTSDNSSVEEQARQLKASASASVSSSFFQASVSASHEKQSKESNSSAKKDFSSSMAWEATGGDTLLCNNPAEWCSTVNLHDNWRIVNQDEVIPLYKFLAKFTEVGENIIDRFEKSAKNSPGPTSLQYNFQVFKLVFADLLTIAVYNDDTTIFEEIKKSTGFWAEDDKTAAASVKILGVDEVQSEIASHFVVSKDVEPGKDANIRYGEVFRANSLGHPKNWSLASHITEPKSSRKTDLVWAHLVGEHGSICLYDVDNPERTDYVRNDDRVYLCLNNTNGTNPQGPQLVDETTSGGHLSAMQTWPSGQKEPPAAATIMDKFRLQFQFKILEPYKGQRAPGPTS